MEEQEVLQRIDVALEKRGDLRSMTEFQLRNFVIGSQPTVIGQYQQVCIELERRKLTLKELGLKNKILQLDKQDLISNNSIPRERCNIELELKEMEIEQLNKAFHELEFEIDVLIKISEELSPDLPQQINWEQHQSEYWKKKLGREAWIAWNTIGAIPSDVLRAAMSLPDQDRNSFLKQIEQITGAQRTMLSDETKRD